MAPSAILGAAASPARIIPAKAADLPALEAAEPSLLHRSPRRAADQRPVGIGQLSVSELRAHALVRHRLGPRTWPTPSCTFPTAGFEHGLTKAFFVGSGSEANDAANDAAMKCARPYWQEQGQDPAPVLCGPAGRATAETPSAACPSPAWPAASCRTTTFCRRTVAFVSTADAFHGRQADETEGAFVGRLLAELEAEFLRLGPENVISRLCESFG